MVDLTITISAILAVCAIISPILVALVNNHHHKKMRLIEMQHEVDMKKAELTYNRVMPLFEEYLGALEACSKHPTREALQRYGTALGNALMYASNTAQNAMLDIDATIRRESYFEIPRETISNVSGLLRVDLKEYEPDRSVNN